MEGIAVEDFTNLVDPGCNETKPEFHLYISDDNEQNAFDSYDHLFHPLQKLCIRNISVWYIKSMGLHQWFC